MKFSMLPAVTALVLFSSTVMAQAATVPKLSDLTKTTDSSSSTSDTASSKAAATITDTNTDTGTDTATKSIPRITGTATETSGGGLTGLPKLSGAYSYPPATVPPTQNAPYMQVSSMPEGTVFIAVGAILGFAALMTLAWRGLIAWSLHRSVKRAALQQQLADNKAQFPIVAPMYKYSDRESTISLGHRGKKTPRPSTAGHAAAASQSLFFSPTAGAAGAGAGGISHAGNRGSNYLPAGYYAAGASAPGGGGGMTTIGTGSRENINMSNLRPQSQGYSQSRISPPDSPAMYAQQHRAGNMSTSTLDLNPNAVNARTTAPRAPSAYFDDLLDESSGAPRPSSHGQAF